MSKGFSFTGSHRAGISPAELSEGSLSVVERLPYKVIDDYLSNGVRATDAERVLIAIPEQALLDALVELDGLREKNSTVSALAESGFTPEGAIGKTVGLSYKPEVQ